MSQGTMDIKYMPGCIVMSMGPAKHEQVVIFLRKVSGLRMKPEKSSYKKGENDYEKSIS